MSRCYVQNFSCFGQRMKMKFDFSSFFSKDFFVRNDPLKFQIYPEIFWHFCLSLFLMLWIKIWAHEVVPFQISGPSHCYFLIYGSSKLNFFFKIHDFPLYFSLWNRQMSLPPFMFSSIKSKPLEIGQHVSPFWKEE